MAKKKLKMQDNDDDGGAEEEEPDFSDPEDYVDDITDDGEWGGDDREGQNKGGWRHGFGYSWLLQEAWQGEREGKGGDILSLSPFPSLP